MSAIGCHVFANVLFPANFATSSENITALYHKALISTGIPILGVTGFPATIASIQVTA